MILKVKELKEIYNEKSKEWKLVTETQLVEMGKHSYFDIIIKKNKKRYLVCLKQIWFNSDIYDEEKISLIEL